MKNKKQIKRADVFFARMLKDPVIRINYAEERTKSSIAQAVKAARLRAKLTQAALARDIGTTQSVIARLEGPGIGRVPSLALLARIAFACHGKLELGINFKRVA